MTRWLEGALAHAPWSGPPLGPVEWWVLWTLLLYLALVEPYLGARFFEGFRRAGADPGARRERWFAGLVGMQAALLAVTAVLVVLLPGMTPERAGVAWGHPPSAVALGMIGGALAGMLLAAVAAGRAARGEATPSAGPAAQREEVLEVLLPRNRRERGWLAAVSVGAGTGEELLYRGLLPALLVGAGLPVGWALAVQAALFGAAHRYQGVGGVAVTTVLGVLLGLLATHTGSLLIPVLLHTALDLRLSLAPRRGVERGGPGDGSPAPPGVTPSG